MPVSPALSMRVGLVVLLAFAAPPPQAHAQEGTLRGSVVDSTGAPVRDASIGIIALRQLTRTDESGRFAFGKLPRGSVELSVRRLGYQPRTVGVFLTAAGTDSVSVTLMAQPTVLDAIAVSAFEFRRRQGIEDFHQRRVQGIGVYVTREEILARGAHRPTDVLRSKPGLRVVRLRGSNQGLRFVSSANLRRDCMPMIWIDGQRAPGMEVDDLSLGDIEAIELYAGPSTTPFQFSQGSSMSTCGTIAFWSRSPGR